MSHTIRNERTKGWLDKLAVQRKARKLIRDFKNDAFFCETDDDFYDFFVPTAEI